MTVKLTMRRPDMEQEDSEHPSLREALVYARDAVRDRDWLPLLIWGDRFEWRGQSWAVSYRTVEILAMLPLASTED